jgi:GT2 family glycosyltransferase
MEEKPTPDVRLSVSIVLYNSSLELLLRTLDSLCVSARRAQASQSLVEVSVQVIDNSVKLKRRDKVREALEVRVDDDLVRVSYIATGENRGFGAGHNLAMQSVDSDFHLILNPDAELEESTLEIGLASLKEDAGVVLLSPEVSGDDGAQEFLCKRYPSILVLVLRAFAPRFIRRLFRRRLYRYEMRDVCTGKEEAEVMLASGCFMLVRTEALQAVGGFDERYFVYFEDFDLSLRLGGKGRVVYHPDMKIVHHGGYAARKGSWHVKLFINSGIEFFNSHGWRWI